jgi:hypothetical protein
MFAALGLGCACLTKFVPNGNAGFTQTFPSLSYKFDDRVELPYKNSMASKRCGAFPCQ